MTLLERIKELANFKPKGLDRELHEGHLAETILRDELFSQIVDDMRTKIIEEWAKSPLRDIEGREKLRLMILILDQLIQNIERSYQAGLLARKQVADDRKKPTRRK